MWLTPRMLSCLALAALLLVACPAEETPTPTPTPVNTDLDNDGYAVSDGDCNDLEATIHPGTTDIPYDGIDQNCSDGDLVDVDRDGDPAEQAGGHDCDDEDPSVSSLATEIQDGQDNDCNGKVDDNTRAYDDDGDSFSELEGDCDDLNPDRYPGADEVPYDEEDQDCDGSDLRDVDDDGVDATQAGGKDCDDEDPDTYPGAEEVPYDGTDQDCSGSDLNDLDGDGYIGSAAEGPDCDDTNQNTHPGATEYADELDNDCDGIPDDGLNTHDDDGDGLSEAQGDCDDTRKDVFPGAVEVPYDGVDQDCSGKDLNDLDQDGFPSTQANGTDCNDLDATQHPGATEVPYDGIDQDCSGGDLLDQDGDGFADIQHGGSDCNDLDASISPVGIELCDGIDNNCSGQADEDAQDAVVVYQDADLDGFGNASQSSRACQESTGWVFDATDCDDASATTYPGAAEQCNGIDDSCDQQIDEASAIRFYQDADQDGYGDPAVVHQGCNPPSGYVSNGTDCDDTNPSLNPGMSEVCNGKDENCNGQADEDLLQTFYQDSDRDGFGNPNVTTEACGVPSGYAIISGDCNDQSAQINPTINEVCDGVDQDCNGRIDDGVTITVYQDQDRDGFGNPSVTLQVCSLGAGQSNVAGDCDDTRANVNPNALEVCDALDNDCDQSVDEDLDVAWYSDLDGDDYGTGTSLIQSCFDQPGLAPAAGDCNDTNAEINPGADEGVDDFLDQNCDGFEACFADQDLDGFRAEGDATVLSEDFTCTDPGEATTAAPAGDCNDQEPAIHPGVDELCNSLDDDCDGSVDEGVTQTWYADQDHDGYGNAQAPLQACTQPSSYVQDASDCNDKSAASNPAAAEICDGLDNNCALGTDEGGICIYGDGSDGNLTVTGTTSLTFTSTALAQTVSAGATSITVSSGAGFAAGNQVLIIDLQGSISSGGWDLVRLTGVSGNVLSLASGLTRNYPSTDKVMVQKVPQYANVNIAAGATLTGPTWDGSAGGVLAFLVKDTLSVSGTLSMVGKGYRGGAGSASRGQDGEGYLAPPKADDVTQNNGGGGGAYHINNVQSGGGGGGGHRYAGTDGTADRTAAAGKAGQPYADTVNRKLFLGGGGGGGSDTRFTAGANGGGIILVAVKNFASMPASGLVDATGGKADDLCTTAGDAGGGGAGGSIGLLTASTVDSSKLVVNGGKGGSSCSTGNGGNGGLGVVSVWVP